MAARKRIRVRENDRVRHAVHGDGTSVGDNTYDQNTYGAALIRFDSGECTFVQTYELSRIASN